MVRGAAEGGQELLQPLAVTRLPAALGHRCRSPGTWQVLMVALEITLELGFGDGIGLSRLRLRAVLGTGKRDTWGRAAVRCQPAAAL